MSDGIPDGAEDVVGVLTERIEAHFGMGMDQLKDAVGAKPTANPDATEVVKWHGLLVQAQSVLDRAEDELLAALESQPSEVDDPTMGLAHRVNEAVTVRDGRAIVVRWLLDPDAPGKKGFSAARLARLRSRSGPAVQTTAPRRPAEAPPPASASAGQVGRLTR
ncbi:hypothetical protein K388_02737 [Streptomyces sp. KhCrAH-43]|uniref:hypothetical protein n=1 Tax=unclassified Streptomyces TaxID=2593676 RepID=UPI0003732D11|nr:MULTISPECIES: hypothetical protein [unclassified Streptomyces]MYS36729.1 hypothetical protein [Streptomyces sp. SID4920]MYX69200.1 hypothetical protein [Streptomyces sp. SID8373]RAJ62051.1 hypothetical protein K388_02737 [Streptomyces sp. KhCrAH-43]